ncbi:class I SAM-dependent methyltransferase [bacterium]|nr:class I SAM-dependent methyltransferase [bacterium]
MSIVEKECCFCGCNQGKILFPKEMYYGTRKTYRYLHCDNCGGLICQDSVPVLEAYPPEYYSFQKVVMSHSLFSNARALLRKFKTSILLGHFSMIRSVMAGLFSEHYLFPWLRNAKIEKSSRILDVGCGAGALLFYLKDCGFKSLKGIDPNIESDMLGDECVTIWKKSLDSVVGKFDLISFQNVLEHTENPLEVLLKSKELLADDGHILIFTPVSDCHAFRKYGIYWASLDAPRHLSIPSTLSMHLLAEKAGLFVVKSDSLSSAFQFLNSELYMANISSTEISSDNTRNRLLFSKHDVSKMVKATKYLDTMRDGDSAMFLLKPNV